VRRSYLIGVGNETMADDGIGPRIADALEARARAAGFETVVIGHDTLGILSYFDDNTERIVLVDCVRMGRRPGDCAVFSPDEVETQKQVGRMTTHDGDLLRVIALARQTGLPIPPIAIVAVEPERIEQDLALSETLRARFDEYLAVTLLTMERWGRG
jgi:hydrogenase maturation protease